MPDPLDAATAELWAGFEVANRVHDRTGSLGEAVLVLARASIDVLDRLRAALGTEAGGAIWRAAMARHTERVRAWGRGEA